MKLIYRNKRQKGLLIISLILIGLFSRCTKFVEVGVPTTQIVTTTVFSDDNAATAAQLAVYAQMTVGDAENVNRWTGLSSDELYSYYNNQSYTNLYTNSLLMSDVAYFNEWQPAYSYLYNENAVLENLQKSTSISPKVSKQLTGEALFMRAYWYFYLTNLYGDVPLILTTDYKSNNAMARTSQVQVYQQMIIDLKKAQGLLNPGYVDGTDTVITVDRARPSSWAARAMLARVYLYSGKYDSAEMQASMVIGNSATYSLSPLFGDKSVFMKNSTEAIWQIIPATTRGWTPEGSDQIILTAPPPTGSYSGSLTISPQLLNAFESGDQRQTNWVGIIKDSKTGIVYYFPYKYKSSTTAALPTKEYSMIIRLGELYLIRAEARARQNNLDGAVDDMNVLRTRAMLKGLNKGLSQSQTLAAIAHERQVELFTEGHRWFDLKRTKTVDSVMSVVTKQKGGNWQSSQQLYPIPQETISNGLNIVQNSGY